MKLWLMAGAALASMASVANAETREYRMIVAGADIGYLKVDQQGRTYAVDYDYKQNGRGPTIKEQVELGPDGLPVKVTISGRTTFGNSVSERYAPGADGKAVWVDAAGGGSAARPAFYVDQNGSPLLSALLAKALLADADRAMAVLPGGTATLTPQKTFRFDGPDGPVDVTTYALGGLGLSPNYITLDAKGELFATASPDYALIRKGYEKVAEKALRDTAETLGAARLAKLQADHARRFAQPVRLRNVRLFDPAQKKLTGLSDVVVSGKRITQVTSAGSKAGAGEVSIDAKGAAMVPGMYEMHGHVGQQDGLLNLLTGITSIRDMGNDNEVLQGLIARIEAGEVAGPRITRSGFIEGKSKYSSRTGILVGSAPEAVEAVKWYAKRGFRQVKLYNSMTADWNRAAIAEAKRLGLSVAGHVPAFSSADEMIAAGFNEITHVNQLMLGWVLKPEEDTRTLFRFTAQKRFPTLDLNGPKVTATIDEMVRRKVAHEPTLAIHEVGLTALDGEVNAGARDYIENMPPSEQRAARQALFGADTPKDRADYVAAFGTIKDTLRLMHKRGILLIPGTDFGGALTYHRELQLFEQLGLSRGEVLARATLDMARYLGQDRDLGSIERGKFADFFLVEGDPTADLRHLKRISLVVKDGAFYVPADIHPAFGIKPFAKGIALPKR